MKVPMLPKIAMPRAPPSSAVVSEIADAAPARSGGVDPTTRSVVNVNTGASPKDEMTNPVDRKRNDVDASIWISSPNPTAATDRPPAMIDIGEIRRTILGVKVDPTTNARAHGSIHIPASSGDKPRTSCRYCERNKNTPKVTKTPSNKVTSEVLNVDRRNSRRSIRGYSTFLCLCKKNMANAAPIPTNIIDCKCHPSWAISLIP